MDGLKLKKIYIREEKKQEGDEQTNFIQIPYDSRVKPDDRQVYWNPAIDNEHSTPGNRVDCLSNVFAVVGGPTSSNEKLKLEFFFWFS